MKELINDYESTIDNKLTQEPDSIGLDLALLNAFISNNKVLIESDKDLCKITNTRLEDIGADNS